MLGIHMMKEEECKLKTVQKNKLLTKTEVTFLHLIFSREKKNFPWNQINGGGG